MAEVNLQAYGAHIETLLASGAADEASYHSRHILSQYPRYTPAFRLLGRALLLKGQQTEAEAAFRRVLSVEPDDISAHLGLSEIYDQRKRGDEAIWHAERAMETEIANAVTGDLLRDLYQRYRSGAEPRMALTAVGLTRQALQNRDYPQAIATLRDALERHPERIDLRLLLAEALWQSGDHVTAGETAIDVLEILPDCFSANVIMTHLWLEEGRPSDAQPYLNRLEALDPYAAVEIASGQPADPATFTISALDYQRTAQSDAARAAPDWLQSISGETIVTAIPSGWSSGMLAAAHSAEVDQPAAANIAPYEEAAVIETAAAEDLFAAAEEKTFALPAQNPRAEDVFTFDANPPALQIPAAPAIGRIFDNSIAELSDTEHIFEVESPASDIFISPFDEREAEAAPASVSGATNPLPPVEEISPRPMPPAEDAMAWLRESGVELVDDEAPAFSTETGEEFPTEGPHDQSDPMAWLNTYDSMMEDDPAASDLPPASTVIFEEGWEFDAEEPGLAAQESEIEEPAEVAESPQLFAAEESPVEPVPSASGALRGLTSRLGDSAVAATGGIAAVTPSSASADDWAATFDHAPAAADAAADSPEWLTDLGAVMTTEPDITPAGPDEQGEPLPISDASESADWLSELEPGELAQDIAAASESPAADWLADPGAVFADAEAVIEPGLPDWLMEDEPHAEPATEAGVKVPADDADILPDWLIEHAPGAAEAASTVEATEAGVEELDWLNTLNSTDAEPVADLDEAVLAAQADAPDWLDNLEAEALALIDANQQAAAESAADDEWPQMDAEAPAEPLPFAEVEGFEAAAVEPVAEAFDHMPLMASAAAVANALSSDSPGEQVEISPEDWGEPEQADLSRIAPPTVSIEGGEPASMPDVAPGDWFADDRLAAEAPVPNEGSLAVMPTDDWFADEALLAPAEAEMVTDEWIISPEGADALPYAASVEGFAAAGLGVLDAASSGDEIETEAGEPAVLNAGGEDDEWLMTEWPEDADGGQLQPDDLDALPDAEIAEETVIAPASNAPDWLNAMVPGLDLDYDVAGDGVDEHEFASEGINGLDETLGARSEYGWVVDLVEQEELETEAMPAAALTEAAEAPRFVFRALPAWFKRASENGSDDDFADWPSDDSSLQAWQN